MPENPQGMKDAMARLRSLRHKGIKPLGMNARETRRNERRPKRATARGMLSRYGSGGVVTTGQCRKGGNGWSRDRHCAHVDLIFDATVLKSWMHRRWARLKPPPPWARPIHAWAVQIIWFKRFGLFEAYTFAVDPLRPH